MNKFKFIDLFCGIGGFRVALEKYGLECVFSSDIDKHAQDSYYKNFKEKPNGDITEISEKKIPNHDVLCAGFPCQSFSISGKQAGIKDSRGRLFYEIIRISNYHKPKILLLENVKNILTVDNGNVIKTIEAKLDEIGYNVKKYILNSSYFGVPQSRERVYFVAVRKDYSEVLNNYKEPKITMKKIFLENILEKKPSEHLFVKRDDTFISKKEENIENDFKPIRVGIINKGGQGERIYSPKGHAITLSAYGGGVGARTGLYSTKEGRIRRLSINECKKVMGFSTKHIVSEGIQGYQQLGNAVIPDMIGYIWKNLRIS